MQVRVFVFSIVFKYVYFDRSPTLASLMGDYGEVAVFI